MLYNASGRAILDVSAQGVYVTIAKRTKASATIFSSVVALLNEKRIAKGKRLGPLGRLNLVMYGNPSMFYDIKTGSNPSCKLKGFSTGVEWDPVTWLGSPNYKEIATILNNTHLSPSNTYSFSSFMGCRLI